MKAGEFLNNLATLAGIPADSDALKTILAAQSFSEVDIPDEITAKVNSSLMTMESAKNNTDLVKHFRGSILGSLDARINQVMDAQPTIFTDDVKSKIDGLQSSYDKVSELAKVMAEQSKGSGNDSAELDALKKQIANLNTENSELKAGQENLKSEYEQKLTQKDMGFVDQSVIGSLSFADALDKKDYMTLTQNKVDAKLKEMGAVKHYENGEIKLKKQEGDALVDLYVDNKAVSYSDFVKQTAAESKFLNVGGTPPANPPAPPQGGNGGAPEISTSKYAEALDNASNDLAGGGTE